MHAKVKSEASTKTSKVIKRFGKVETRHVYRPMCQDEISRVRLLRVPGTLRGEISQENFCHCEYALEGHCRPLSPSSLCLLPGYEVSVLYHVGPEDQANPSCIELPKL